MRVLIIGYNTNTVGVFLTIEQAIAKVKEWNSTAVITDELEDNIELDDLIGPSTTLLRMTRNDGSSLKWWVKSIKLYLKQE